MSLSTESVSLGHHGHGPSGKRWRLPQLCVHMGFTLLYSGRGPLHWVRTAQGLLLLTHPSAHEFPNDNPEELKLQVSLAPLNPFPPATHAFPHYVANSMQNWYKNIHARSLVKPCCWGRLPVCTKRIGFIGMGKHPATSTDSFSWAPSPQFLSGSLGKTMTQMV